MRLPAKSLNEQQADLILSRDVAGADLCYERDFYWIDPKIGAAVWCKIDGIGNPCIFIGNTDQAVTAAHTAMELSGFIPERLNGQWQYAWLKAGHAPLRGLNDLEPPAPEPDYPNRDDEMPF